MVFYINLMNNRTFSDCYKKNMEKNLHKTKNKFWNLSSHVPMEANAISNIIV